MSLKNVMRVKIPTHSDNRGVLSAIEGRKDIAFDIKRIFYIYNIKSTRGAHALKDTDELLIAISGHFKVKVYDADNCCAYVLDNPAQALFVPRLIYMEIYDASPDAVCLVLANKEHDLNQYLRSLPDFYNYLKHKDNE